MRTHWIGYGALSLGILGCAGSSQGERVRDAHMAGIDARSEQKSEALDEQAASRKTAINNSFDRREQQIDNANKPGADAQQELTQVSRERTQYRSQAQARLDQLAVRIDAAQKKLDVLGARAPTQLKGELETTAEQYKQLRAQVMKLGDVGPTDWESTTKQIDGRTETLDSRVTRLSDSIDAV